MPPPWLKEVLKETVLPLASGKLRPVFGEDAAAVFDLRGVVADAAGGPATVTVPLKSVNAAAGSLHVLPSTVLALTLTLPWSA